MKPGKHLKVVLEEDNQTLDEVVVVGYGTSRRGDLTGAISSVSEKVLKDIPITSAAAAITGKLAGVNVVATDGSPDACLLYTSGICKANYLRFIAIKNVLSCYTLFKKADLKH